MRGVHARNPTPTLPSPRFFCLPFNLQSNDRLYQVSLIPALLAKTAMDVDTVLEFTRAYGIDDEVPLLIYAEVRKDQALCVCLLDFVVMRCLKFSCLL